MLRSDRSVSPFKRNFLAASIAGLALGFSHLNLDPFVSGADGGSVKSAKAGAPVVTASLSMPRQMAAIDANSGSSVISPLTPIQDDDGTLRGIWAIKMAASLLEKGCRNFASVPDYTASMFRQERINGTLSEEQNIDLKVRHEPFSVYMKWNSGDRGRQLIYVQGQNNGNLLVQPGGIKGRLTGLLSLEPEGDLAMSESRHPITKAGLLQLGHTILEYQKKDIERGSGFVCELIDNQEFEGRACYLYQIVYQSPEIHETYRKSTVFVDKELSLPICVKNYTWARDASPETIDEETLVEFYAYTDLNIQKDLTASDFDQRNKDYKLRVR